MNYKPFTFPILLAALALTSCNKSKLGGNSTVVQKGSAVKINYTLTVDGKVLDSSVGQEPLSYIQGANQIVPGLEEELQGLKAGDKKKVTVAPEKGYGIRDQSAVRKVPKTSFQNMEGLQVGSVVSGQSNGRKFQATVAGIEAKEITLDFNHPLAGKTLNFDIEVVEVKAGTGT